MNTPHHFPEGVADDIKLFEWASNFVTTRAFGWGVPHLTLVPLVDMVNHTDLSKLSLDLFHSKLHLADNKIYMHEYTFETDADGKITPKFDESESKRMHYDVSRFYSEKGEASPDIEYLIKGKDYGEIT